MSDLTDALRLAADFIDGGREPYDFIKKDIKRQLRVYGTELRARAHLLKYKEEYDAVDLDKVDGAAKLKDRDYGRTNRTGPAREAPWWLNDFNRSRYSGRSGG